MADFVKLPQGLFKVKTLSVPKENLQKRKRYEYLQHPGGGKIVGAPKNLKNERNERSFHEAITVLFLDKTWLRTRVAFIPDQHIVSETVHMKERVFHFPSAAGSP